MRIMRGCLLIHGLTSTPAVMAPLKDALLAEDFKVSMPLLSGHGGSPEELAASTWQEWYSTVRMAFAALRRDVDKVYYVGLSLGALLGMKLALDEGWGVRAMALIGLPLKLPLLARAGIGLIRYTPLRWFVHTVGKDLDRSVAKPEGQEYLSHFGLKRMPLAAAHQVMALQREIWNNIERISNPLLLLYGRRDETAPLYNIDLVRGHVASDVVESVIFDRSKHVLTLDWDADEVLRATVEFFRRFS